MNIINGKEVAQSIKDEVKHQIEMHSYEPFLTVIQVGNDPASSTYVKNKENACKYCGIKVETLHLAESISTAELLNEINMLNDEAEVSGILVQLPLPKHIDEATIINAIAPSKDVDGFHMVNVAKLWMNDKSAVIPCTPKGIMKLLESTGIELSGKQVVVIGRSNIVGKPAAKLLMDAGCTVTICHSKTPMEKIEEHCKHADIIVAAVGKPYFVKWCKRGSILIDVGINRDPETNKLCGDIDPAIYKYSSYYTPVPGGVGPMTIACLMENTLNCEINK